MGFIEQIKNQARENNKTIILPESNDERVIKAAIQATKENIANIILIGDKEEINKIENINDLNIKVINPETFDETEKIINDFYELRKLKGITLEEASDLIRNDYMYFSCMLLKEGYADGIVSGAIHSTSDTLRPALQIVKTKENVNIVSSFVLMEVPNSKLGYNGIFVFSDCGLEQNPTSEKLAEIAISSANSFESLTNQKSITAFLSHSTKGSAKHDDVNKVVEAVSIAKEKAPNLLLDGELQLDAAIIPEIGKMKAPSSLVAGHANTLIFPDLDAGNIGYKLVQRLANANAYGPITQGMNKPVNDLSRGCSIEDIVGVIAITSIQANIN